MIRMGQVTEPGAANGQILASIAPGEWNITWVRDMAYATVALVKSGHYAEAKAALAFQMGAMVGAYEPYVGVPYQISVCRYYGDGSEWSDFNQDGPNIEFDGFGLFLWELDEYVTASGDTASLEKWWPAVKSGVGDALVHLQESTGLIAPDSSIWEVHWDGSQRHFAYTTVAAASGLCAASDLAKTAGDSASQSAYLAAGASARDAILASLRAPGGAIGQSSEALMTGIQWLDASPLEAINFGLIDPARGTALATLSAIKAGLVPMTGHGFMRDDTGQWYDSQEWVFIDLRSARAFALQGDATTSATNFAWNVGQGAENFGELSELHDAVTAAYAGASPMVGFGAGAYILALSARGTARQPGVRRVRRRAVARGGRGRGWRAARARRGLPRARRRRGGSSAERRRGRGRRPRRGGRRPRTEGHERRRMQPVAGSRGEPVRARPHAGAGLDPRWSSNTAEAAMTRSRFADGGRDLLPRARRPGLRRPRASGGPDDPRRPQQDAAAPPIDGGGVGVPHKDASAPLDAPAEVSRSVSTAQCFTTFHFTPPAGSTPAMVAVTGEWNAFAAPGVAMAGPDVTGAVLRQGAGSLRASSAYKLLVDGAFELDPASPLEKYVGGVPEQRSPGRRLPHSRRSRW